MDPQFHYQLAYAGKKTVAAIMSQVLSQLSNPTSMKKFQNQPEHDREKQALNILDMHRQIFGAVCSGHPQAVEDAMALHIRSFVDDNC